MLIHIGALVMATTAGLHYRDRPSIPLRISAALQHAGLVFNGIGFFDVGFLVFFGKFDKLQEHLLSWNKDLLAVEGATLTNMLRQLVKPVRHVDNFVIATDSGSPPLQDCQ